MYLGEENKVVTQHLLKQELSSVFVADSEFEEKVDELANDLDTRKRNMMMQLMTLTT